MAIRDYFNFSKSDSTPRYPIVSVLTDEIEYVSQGSWKVVDLNSKKYKLATSGLFTCTGFFGYNSKSKIAFLAHFSDTDDVERNLRRIYYFLKQKYGDFENKFVTYFANPTIPSNRIRELLMKDSELSNLFEFPFDIGSLSIGKLKEGQPSTGVGIDSKSGNIFIFAPEKPVNFKV